MGLNVLAFQNAGIIDHRITHLTSLESNPHRAYREMFESPAAFGINATDDDIAECKALEDELMQDAMQNIPHIITTCSNTADTTLTKTKKPRVTILEEARSAQELETLIAWAHNNSTMMLIVFVGDPIQLPTMVKTRHMNTADKAINPFAPQCCMSFFERLWHRGATVIIFPSSFERQLVMNRFTTTVLWRLDIQRQGYRNSISAQSARSNQVCPEGPRCPRRNSSRLSICSYWCLHEIRDRQEQVQLV